MDARYGLHDTRKLHDATRAWKERERELLDQIARLERDLRVARRERREEEPTRHTMPASCYRKAGPAEKHALNPPSMGMKSRDRLTTWKNRSGTIGGKA